MKPYNLNHLINQGWKEFKPNDILDKYVDRIFYKFWDTPTKCKTNHDKPGVQLCVKYYDRSPLSPLTLDLRAQMKNDVWVELKMFSIENVHQIHELSLQILKMWEAANE